MPTDDYTIRTISGEFVSLLNPDPSTIQIGDICHHLSNLCRFNGATRVPYSVAEHSLFVADICDPQYALAALLHDAPEAYLHDMARPIKRLIKASSSVYEAAEERMWFAICLRFGIDPDDLAHVKEADDIALATEARDLLAWDINADEQTKLPAPHPRMIRPSSSLYVRIRFNDRFNELMERRTPGATDGSVGKDAQGEVPSGA